MLSFLEETLQQLQQKHPHLSQLTLILPSKRAGGFVRNILKKQSTATRFAPVIISIEEFIEQLSNLKIADPTELLFKSYQAYLSLYEEDTQTPDDFETYSGWIPTLLSDFNEIDRYLVDTQAFFDYLEGIKALERWNFDGESTPLLADYLAFWKQLPIFHDRLKQALLSEGVAYQGLVYRKASEDIEYYLASHGTKKHVFIGFNALNTAEQHIIQALLETGHTEVYWDADRYFFEDNRHSASLFQRKYARTWNYYLSHPFESIGDHFSQEKNMHLVTAQKSLDQVKYVGGLLENLTQEQLNNTAIVLADEQLLTPLLYSLPAHLDQVNITMGVNIKATPAATFFYSLIRLHLQEDTTYYFKDVTALLQHPMCQALLPEREDIVQAIIQSNTVRMTPASLCGLGPKDNALMQSLFMPWENPMKAVQTCQELIIALRDSAVGSNRLVRVALHGLYKVFRKVQALHESYGHLKSLRAVFTVFQEQIAQATLDYEGDAYTGLQIMGVLETRCLDFENLIVLSVNEGLLPAGKTTNSYITYDLKQQYQLPSYVEKDAIYTYHFYRLLHRAKNITLVHHNHTEGLSSGDKSRLLWQLEIEHPETHLYRHTLLHPALEVAKTPLRTIDKTDALIASLQRVATKGLSPSSLTSYIRNPMEFYAQKVLGIREFDDVEETVAYNTLGTIVHDSLEVLYKPFEGQTLNRELLEQAKSQVADRVVAQFQKSYGDQFRSGKNLLIYEVAKRYVERLIEWDLTEINAGKTIEIKHIEAELRSTLQLPSTGQQVTLVGKADRIDLCNGVCRIIDYKTGRVIPSDLNLKGWEQLRADYKYSKIFQLLTYAEMWEGFTEGEVGIISFKHMSPGFMPVSLKIDQASKAITGEVLSHFRQELIGLIEEIFDQATPFVEKETA